jgi:hypothetical protein
MRREIKSNQGIHRAVVFLIENKIGCEKVSLVPERRFSVYASHSRTSSRPASNEFMSSSVCKVWKILLLFIWLDRIQVYSRQFSIVLFYPPNY